MCDACRTKVIGVAHDSGVGRRVGAAQISRSLHQRSLLVRDVRRRLGRRTHERSMPLSTGAQTAVRQPEAGTDAVTLAHTHRLPGRQWPLEWFTADLTGPPRSATCRGASRPLTALCQAWPTALASSGRASRPATDRPGRGRSRELGLLPGRRPLPGPARRTMPRGGSAASPPWPTRERRFDACLWADPGAERQARQPAERALRYGLVPADDR